MKRICFLLILQFSIFNLPSSYAQSGQWTYIHGQKGTGVVGTYGTRTMPAAANNPPGLYEACQWTDTSGQFWLFGGIDYMGDINGDLWQYNPSTNQWAWMNGRGPTFVNDPGNYGTQGVPSLNNIPPSRSHGMTTWTDKNNNLWFFGGGAYQQVSSYNDLWEYNISTNEWVWVKGPEGTGDPGHYGTQGVPDTANNPPNRAECAAAWVDSSGDFWLFGGQCFVNGGVYNDLWRYNIASNTWTWMKGSDLTNQASNYGTQKIESATNNPGGRGVYAHLKDNNENLWLFGGFSSTSATQNDIWRYDPVTNNWVWLGGTKNGGAKSIYGTQCVADSTNIPGGRFENRACWKDKNGNLWFFGGFLTDPPRGDRPETTNELWLYCIESNKWTFVSGDTIPDPAGNWGTINVSSPTNKPDGRAGSVSWIDKTFGDLYLYGGSVDSFPYSHNDLWKFTIDTTCGVCAATVLPTANFQVSDSVLCANDCVTYTDLSTNATSWIWTFPGGSPSSSTDENPNVCYLDSGTFDVTLIATSYTGSNTIKFTKYISVNPAPPTPVITVLHGDTLYCSTDTAYVSYQWFDDTTLIPGATDTLLLISHSGNFNVKVTGTDGCSIAVGINVVGIQEFTVDGLQFTVSPNPTGDELTITGTSKKEIKNLNLDIYNVLGQNMLTPQLPAPHSLLPIVLNVSSLPSGIYFIQISSNEAGRWIGRFVKE